MIDNKRDQTNKEKNIYKARLLIQSAAIANLF